MPDQPGPPLETHASPGAQSVVKPHASPVARPASTTHVFVTPSQRAGETHCRKDVSVPSFPSQAPPMPTWMTWVHFQTEPLPLLLQMSPGTQWL